MTKSEQLNELKLKKMKLLSKKDDVMQSQEYKLLMEKIYALQTTAMELLDSYATASIEMEIQALETAIMHEILESGKNDDGFYKLDKKVNKAVNIYKVKEQLRDADQFMELVTISQKKLKEMAGTFGIDPNYCIEVVAEEVVGIKAL